MATQIGTDLAIGCGTITGSYIVQSRDTKNFELDTERIFDENGALKTLLTFNSFEMIRLDLICITGAAPQTDFVMGQIAAHTDFTTFYVEDVTITQTKSAKRVSVSLKNLGITA